MCKFKIIRTYDNMFEVILSQGAISQPVVSTNCAAWLNNSFYKRCQTGGGSILQVLQTNTPKCFFAFIFDRNADECFPFSTATTLARVTPTGIASSRASGRVTIAATLRSDTSFASIAVLTLATVAI